MSANSPTPLKTADPEAQCEALSESLPASLKEACEEAARLLEGGNADLAELQSRRILEQAPDCVEALLVLSQCVKRRQTGGQEYESVLRQILRRGPHRQASPELAELLLSRGALEECEEHARAAVALAPGHPLAQRTMGIVFLNTGRPAAAEVHFRRLIALVGERPRVCAWLADSLKLQGKLDESEQWMAKTAALDPSNVDLWVGWCRMAEARRNIPQAWEMLRRAESIAPQSTSVRMTRAILLARESRQSEADEILSESLVKDPRNAQLFLERGRIRREMGRYDEAWNDFCEGKRLCREVEGLRYEAERVDALVRRLTQFFTRDRMATLPRADERPGVPQPVFVLGFPRSGTTMVEQILSEHPRIRAGDELEFLAHVVRIAPRWTGSPKDYPACLAELSIGDNLHIANLLRDSYLGLAGQWGLLAGEYRYFTDKMPLNEMHLGLLAILFPRAPLIYVRRHPLDVVCSNFERHLTHGYNQAFDVATIARHYALMDDLMAHYRREIDLNLLEVRYEDVVFHEEREVRRMLDFAGLEFDPRCLLFHESARVPRTISYTQVGEKLHNRSVNRYRHFRQHLDGAVSILRHVLERHDYPID